MVEIVRLVNNPTPNKERWISNWNLLINSHNEYWLIGEIRITDQEVPLAPGAQIRMTETSPIKSVNGRDIITSSNSVYHLVGRPSQTFMDKYWDKDTEYVYDSDPLWFIKDRL